MAGDVPGGISGLNFDRRRVLAAIGAAGGSMLAGCSVLGGRGLTVDVAEEALLSDQLSIEISGVESGESIVVEAQMADADDSEWTSSATFTANDGGVVNLADQAPTDGDYDGAHPMGLLWSMTPVNQTATEADNSGESATESEGSGVNEYFETGPESEHDLQLTVTVGDESTEETVTLKRASEDVSRHEIDADWLHGEWWEPAGEGPHPPLLVLHGSGGEPLSTRAATFASYGYAALAIEYFGPKGLPPVLEEVPLEYVIRSVDWFLERDAVAGDDVGVYGVSKGAELALLLASHDDRVAAVVADSASGYVMAGVDNTFSTSSSWSVDGEPVAYLPYSDNAVSQMGFRDGGRALRDLYAAMVEEAAEDRREAAAIPVEEGSARYLLLSGADDQLWPAADLSAVTIDRLDAAGYEHPYEHRVYENAGHDIGIPHTPQAWAPVSGFYAMGGTQDDRGKAAADAWPRILDTLDAALR